MNLKETIQFWASELLNPTGNDLLVDIEKSKRFFKLEKEENQSIIIDNQLRKILIETKKNKRSIGVDSLCIIKEIVIWEWKGKVRHTPLLLCPISFEENRINQTIKIRSAAAPFFNPFLVKTLEKYIDFSLPIDDVKQSLCEATFISEIKDLHGLANVHHHRFSIVKELEQLTEKEVEHSNLSHLLGFTPAVSHALELSDASIFSSDTNQAQVFEALKVENTVVQGPPGTGKSQVIANVLAKSCANQAITALLAEKPVALQVVYDKLKKYNLHYLCSFYSGIKSNAQNVSNLENTYTFLENFSIDYSHNLNLSSQKLNALQQKIDKLNSPAIIGGVDYPTFKQLATHLQFNKDKFDANAPDLKEWLQAKPYLTAIFGGKQLSFGWTKIKHLQQYTLDQINRLSEQIEYYLSNANYALLSPADIERRLKQVYYTHLFYYSGKELDLDLLKKNSTVQKRFFKLYNAFMKQSDQLKQLEKEKSNWKREFSDSELSDFISALSTADRFNLKTRKKRKALSKLTTTHLSNLKEALENLKKYNTLKAKQIEVKHKLRKLEIEPNYSSLIAIKNIIDRVNASDQNQLEKLSKLSSFERKSILEQEEYISDLHHFLNRFTLDEQRPINQQLKAIKQSLPTLISYFSEIKKLSTPMLKSLSKANSIQSLEETICISAQIKFESLHPAMRSFDGAKLNAELEEIEHLQVAEFRAFADHILHNSSKKFNAYHTLLNTPAAKLSKEQKVLKVKLRKGKAILVKEFSKSRSHKSPLELNSSEAKLWIDVLHPIKLLSTYQMASDYPLEKASFDIVVFDEASQIPLAHSFGGVYRAKRILVAGDAQQMSPSTFFKSNFDAIDLLHQAAFHFKNTQLTHHYRASHPALIAFSNLHFYKNELKTYQAYPIQYPIELVRCNGMYTEKGNLKEAQTVAKLITEKLTLGKYDFGVVTFNEKQLKLIYNQLTVHHQSKIDQLVEDGLIFKALENVQGDECNHLIISLGFAYNAEGKFDMRFGPINQENGAKRLNVLFSRAKEKLTWVCSVSASDFKISDNLGVDLLRKFMLFAEQAKTNQPFFPSQLNIKQRDNHLQIETPFAYFKTSLDLFTYYAVMRARGWELSFEV